MPIIPVDVSSIYSAIQNQSTRFAEEEAARENQKPDEPRVREERGEAGPAVTTTISQAALETAQAVEPPQRSFEQSQLGQEIADDRAVESRQAQNYARNESLEEDRQTQDAIERQQESIDVVV